MRTGLKGLRVSGHRLTMEWSGEYGVESSSTGYCTCGWSESCSSQKEVRNEYRFHLEKVRVQDRRVMSHADPTKHDASIRKGGESDFTFHGSSDRR